MYRRQQPFIPNDYHYTDQMNQYPYTQQQPRQASNNHYMFTNQEPMQQTMQQETPFEYFTKPLQPTEWPMYSEQENMNYYPPPYSEQYQHLNQNQFQYQNQNQNSTPSFLTQFKDENGQMNFDKVISTVGQLANTFQQVTPVIQQVSAMVKTFR